MAFTVAGGTITAIDALGDPERLVKIGVGPGKSGELVTP
jgi:hypothetical protein